MFVFGTAGHIDHGKTALIYSLTSMDTDRLPEEKRRGMTIDLGFAWTKLSTGETVGIVDVPGHENLIKNMIAGTTGIDAFILVIDANEGWMPQTEEHFQIMNLLNIQFGIIVITKIDLVNNDRISLVEKQIRVKMADTLFSNIPIIKVSTINNIGIDQVKSSIQNLIPKMQVKKDIGKPRLSIDRVFSMKGSGTVITGTLINGKFHKGMEIMIFPNYRKSRIRNLQAYKEEVKEALPGSRVAINLAGIEKNTLHRGDIVFGMKPVIQAGRYIDAQVYLLSQTEHFQLKNGANLDFYCGTKEVVAKIILNKKKYLSPSEKCLVQFRFNEPIAAFLKDRFILRIPSPPQTIGGGIILDPQPKKHSFKDNDIVNQLLRRVTLKLKTIILTEIEKYKYIKKDELLINSHHSQKEIYETQEQLGKEGKIIVTDSFLIDRLFWQEQIGKFKNQLDNEYRIHPLEKGFPLSRFQGSLYYLPQEIFSFLFTSQIITKKIIVENGIISLPYHQVKIPPEKEKMMIKMLHSIQAHRANPLNEKSILLQTGSTKEMIRYLIQEEKIIKLNEGILLEKNQYDTIKKKLINFLKKNGSISISEVRTLLGFSRKYIIPLLTKMDEDNITIRQGNFRTLKYK